MASKINSRLTLRAWVEDTVASETDGEFLATETAAGEFLNTETAAARVFPATKTSAAEIMTSRSCLISPLLCYLTFVCATCLLCQVLCNFTLVSSLV